MKIDLRTGLELLGALAALNGSPRVVRDGEREIVVQEPYKFGMGFRLAIAKNIYRLKELDLTYRHARDAVIMELSQGSGRVTDPDAIARLNIRDQQLLAAKQEIPLVSMTIGELNLDQNAIPSTVIAALAPLIEGQFSDATAEAEPQGAPARGPKANERALRARRQ